MPKSFNNFQTSRTCKFFGSRRWETPKQIGNTLWAPWVAPESHVGPAVEGRHWDSTKTAVGSRSRKRTRPARRLRMGKISPYTHESSAGITSVNPPTDSAQNAENSIWAPRDDDESHVRPAGEGRHWDSPKHAEGT